MPGRRVVAVLAANAAGVTALALSTPATVSVPVASRTPPIWLVVALPRERTPPLIAMPPVGETLTPPNCVVEAMFRLRVTLPEAPPPERPAPPYTPVIVPAPGGSAESTPFESISRLAPTLIPPNETFVAGSKSMVPLVVMVVAGPGAPRPTPVVIPVKVPPNAEATSKVPN